MNFARNWQEQIGDALLDDERSVTKRKRALCAVAGGAALVGAGLGIGADYGQLMTGIGILSTLSGGMAACETIKFDEPNPSPERVQ